MEREGASALQYPCGGMHSMRLVLSADDARAAGRVVAQAFESSEMGASQERRFLSDIHAGIFLKTLAEQTDEMVPRRYFLTVRNDDSAVVGISGLYRLAWAWERSYWLGWFAVVPDCQGQGVGSEMLQTIVRIARTDGAEQLKIETARGSRATDFYKRHGFSVEIGSLRRHYGPHLDAIVLTRDLSDVLPLHL